MSKYDGEVTLNTTHQGSPFLVIFDYVRMVCFPMDTIINDDSRALSDGQDHYDLKTIRSKKDLKKMSADDITKMLRYHWIVDVKERPGKDDPILFY